MLTRATKCAITAFQKHKMTAKEILKFKEACREAGLKMECSPCDKTTKIPSAVAGMAVRNDIVFI